jgi:hypothetical protein
LEFGFERVRNGLVKLLVSSWHCYSFSIVVEAHRVIVIIKSYLLIVIKVCKFMDVGYRYMLSKALIMFIITFEPTSINVTGNTYFSNEN